MVIPMFSSPPRKVVWTGFSAANINPRMIKFRIFKYRFTGLKKCPSLGLLQTCNQSFFNYCPPEQYRRAATKARLSHE